MLVRPHEIIPHPANHHTRKTTRILTQVLALAQTLTRNLAAPSTYDSMEGSSSDPYHQDPQKGLQLEVRLRIGPAPSDKALNRTSTRLGSSWIASSRF